MSDKGRQLVAIVAGIAGVTFNSVISGCRRRPLPTCRWLVAQELIHIGYSSCRAASDLRLSHCTVLYGCQMLDRITEDNGYYDTDELFIKREFQRLKNDL